MSGLDGNPTSPDESGSNNLPSVVRSQSSISPISYLGRSHSKKDLIATAIDGLVGFLNNQKMKSDQRAEQNLSSSGGGSDRATNIQRAMALYQEVHAAEASTEDSLAAFKIFRNDINAQIFTSINNKDLRSSWLQEQIDEMKNNQ